MPAACIAASAASAALQQQQQQQRGGGARSSGGSRPTAAAPRRRRAVVASAQQGDEGGMGEGVKRFAKRFVGGLPVVGLISRLTATEGGIGNDAQAYPEYSRKVFDAAPQGFQIAVAELQNKYGKAAQRRYVLLALWMARNGAGVLPGKAVVDAARRLRVSQDLEYEMDRFAEDLREVNAKYTYMERPSGSAAQQADVAVDAVARLVANLKDGQPIPAEDVDDFVECVAGGFWDVPGFKEEVRRSIAEREQREKTYA